MAPFCSQCSSRQNRRVPVWGAYRCGCLRCVETVFSGQNFMQRNMGLCCMNRGEWGRGAVLSSQKCGDGLASGWKNSRCFVETA